VLLLALAGWGSAARAAKVTAQVRIRSARITGNPSASRKFKQTARRKKPALAACYRANLAKHPGEVGLLAANVRVEPNGRISKVEVREHGLNAALKGCALKRIRGWRVPGWKAPHRVYARLELVFQLSATPAANSTIKGGIPPRLVAGTIEARLPGLRKACLKGQQDKLRRRRRHPPKVRLLIDFDGSTQTAGLSGRVPRRRMRRCLVSRLKGWDFPPPDNGHRTWVLYPLFPSPPSSSPPGNQGRAARRTSNAER
jgi:hypothetical protein